MPVLSARSSSMSKVGSGLSHLRISMDSMQHGHGGQNAELMAQQLCFSALKNPPSSPLTAAPTPSPSRFTPCDVFSAQPNQIRQSTLPGRPSAKLQTHLTPALEAPDWQRWRRISLTALGSWRSDMVAGVVIWMLTSSLSVVRCRQLVEVEERPHGSRPTWCVSRWVQSKRWRWSTRSWNRPHLDISVFTAFQHC